MNFSTKGRYGLRAMIDLAVHSEEAVPISSIAARENISECYLEQLAAKLKKAGLVVSTRSVWQKINDSMTKAVDDIDLAQLAEESRRARAQFAEAKAAEKAADPCKGVQ